MSSLRSGRKFADQFRKSGVVAVVLVVFAGLGFAANASDGTIDFSSETAQIVPAYVAGAYVEACLNEYCPGPADGGYIGAFYAEAADGDREFAWCIQAGALIGTSVFNTYSEVTIDGRVSYLTWRYDRDLFDAGGVANYELAAVQALAWAWVADARFDPDVFSGTDPLEWDGLTPSTWTSSPSNRVGFSTNKAAFTSDMGLATQATYDLAVEATAKAGPWGLVTSASGVTLSGSNGPIEGEEISFNSGGSVSTDSSGFAAWPTGATSASVEGPGTSFETRPSGSQDVLVSTVGIELSADRPADSPTPTTTTSTTTTTTTSTSTTVAPTTTTSTSTTVAPTTTTSTSTTVAPTTTTSTSTTVAPTTTTSTSTTVAPTTTSDPGPPILPATGMSAHGKHLPVAVLLVTCGALVALGTRRSHSA